MAEETRTTKLPNGLEMPASGARNDGHSSPHRFEHDETEWLSGGGRDEHPRTRQLLLDVSDPTDEGDTRHGARLHPLFEVGALRPVADYAERPSVLPQTALLPGFECGLRVLLWLESLKHEDGAVDTCQTSGGIGIPFGKVASGGRSIRLATYSPAASSRAIALEMTGASNRPTNEDEPRAAAKWRVLTIKAR